MKAETTYNLNQGDYTALRSDLGCILPPNHREYVYVKKSMIIIPSRYSWLPSTLELILRVHIRPFVMLDLMSMGTMGLTNYLIRFQWMSMCMKFKFLPTKPFHKTQNEYFKRHRIKITHSLQKMEIMKFDFLGTLKSNLQPPPLLITSFKRIIDTHTHYPRDECRLGNQPGKQKWPRHSQTAGMSEEGSRSHNFLLTL